MENNFLNKVRSDAFNAATELIEKSSLKKGSILVAGCSSSEITGSRIGSNSSIETAQAVFEGIYKATQKKGVYLASQSCEHLNRAIIIEEELAVREQLPVVNVIPQPKAGGSFATAAYKSLKKPVAVEHIKADAGIDIGDTLIGMHLKEVAVPLRLSVPMIGEARIVCARTRAKFIGGERAVYDESLI